MIYNYNNPLANNTSSTNPLVKYIKDVRVPRGKVHVSGGSKTITVLGDKDAVFCVEVKRTSDGGFYNFETNLFSTTITSKSRLKNQKPGSFTIAFPSNASGDTYTIIIWAEPHFNTEFNYGVNRLRHAVKLTQTSSNISVTFTTTALGKATATTLATFHGAPGSSPTSGELKSVSLTQIPFTSHADDHGLIMTIPDNDPEGDDPDVKQVYSDVLYFEATENNVGGTAADSNQVVVADLTDLGVGMELTYITGTKTLTLSRNQAITSGHTMTFRAYGQSNIGVAKSADVNIKETYAATTDEDGLGPTTTVRTALTGAATTVLVNGTLGFGVGERVGRKTFVQSSIIENSEDANPTYLSGVSGSVEQGTLTITNGEFQPCDTGTIIYCRISSNKIYFLGNFWVYKYPEVNTTINIDMAKIFHVGTNGS